MNEIKKVEKDEKLIVNICGEIFNRKEAKISVFDRGFLYGDSVYEVARTYNGIPFLLQEHLDRLWHSASLLNLSINYTQDEIVHQVNRALAELGEENAYIRIIITRGEEGILSLDPTFAKSNNLVIIVKDQTPNPKSWYQDGVKVILAKTQRTNRMAVDPNIKSGNYLNSVLAIMEARKEGVYDAIMLNVLGNITEGSHSNIWMAKGKNLVTPPLTAGILEGITRKMLIQLAKGNNIQVDQKDITPNELINADEVFFTSTTREIVPVTQIDNSPIGLGQPGNMTKELIKIYSKFIHQQTVDQSGNG
jgi:branched-chain amino acid aminotransferase